MSSPALSSTSVTSASSSFASKSPSSSEDSSSDGVSPPEETFSGGSGVPPAAVDGGHGLGLRIDIGSVGFTNHFVLRNVFITVFQIGQLVQLRFCDAEVQPEFGPLFNANFFFDIKAFG